MYEMDLSRELRIVGEEASRWAAAAKLARTTDAELVLAAVDRKAELLAAIHATFPIDRTRFVELLKKRRPPHDFSAQVSPPIDKRIERVLRPHKRFGISIDLDTAIRAVVATPSPALQALLESASLRRELLPADWLDAQEFWFPPNTRLPGPGGERVENGPFGNDRMASSYDLEPYLSNPGDDQHLPFLGVTIIVEDPQDDSNLKG